MEFTVHSAFFPEVSSGKIYDPNSDYGKGVSTYLELLKPYTYFKDEQLCMKVDTIQELNDIVDTIIKGFESIEYNNCCWVPTQVIIDFEYKTLLFKDYWIE